MTKTNISNMQIVLNNILKCLQEAQKDNKELMQKIKEILQEQEELKNDGISEELCVNLLFAHVCEIKQEFDEEKEK